MQKFDSIHETGILDIIKAADMGTSAAADTAKKAADNFFTPSKNGIGKMSSLNSAAQGLTLTFPCLCSTSLSIESAGMITKALERKDVALLQILFSAYNLTSADNAADFLKDFHTNLNANKVKLDDVVQLLSGISESSLTPKVSETAIKKVAEDCVNNTNYTFPDDINDTSLRSYSAMYRFGNYDIVKGSSIKEASKYTMTPSEFAAWCNSEGISWNDNHEFESMYMDYLRQVGANDREIQLYRNELDTDKFAYQKIKDEVDAQYNRERDSKSDQYRKDRDEKDDKYKSDRDAIEDERKRKEMELQINKRDIEFAKLRSQINSNRLIPTDVKKANELVPTLMVVNFYTDHDGKFQVDQQAVVGVKSKLYSVNSQDIIDKLVEKNIDSNFLLKLVKLSTREISFVKDFLLSIDSAKISALSKSKKGSSSKLFKILERRALNGRVRKLIGTNINTKPITSLVISIEEVEYMRKYNNTDLMNPNTTRNIMEQLNLMFMVVVDEANEVAHFLADTGDDLYETISFDHLERESNDAGYKKMINLLSRS